MKIERCEVDIINIMSVFLINALKYSRLIINNITDLVIFQVN